MTNSSGRAPIPHLPRYFGDEPERRRYLDGLFDAGAADYDFVEALLGLGSGPWYRRGALHRAGLRKGMAVLDVATGTGLVAREALALAGAGNVVGLDPSAGMLKEATQLGIPLVRGLGERLPCKDASFDMVSMGFALRHVADLEALFSEMRRVLRPGGSVCVLEITKPRGKLVTAALRNFMTRVVPVMARVTGRKVGPELMRFYWDTIEACVRPEVVMQSLRAAGFPQPSRAVSLKIFSEYVATKR
jgi:demethylmenaquinone methyltransferase/2-methoxy-6-polyprenyl-1,4-benzoquinol methylase